MFLPFQDTEEYHRRGNYRTKLEDVYNRYVIEAEPDGNCFLHATMMALGNGFDLDHFQLRQMAVDHMQAQSVRFRLATAAEGHLGQFADQRTPQEIFEWYVEEQAMPGNDVSFVTILSLAEVLNREFRIYTGDAITEEPQLYTVINPTASGGVIEFDYFDQDTDAQRGHFNLLRRNNDMSMELPTAVPQHQPHTSSLAFLYSDSNQGTYFIISSHTRYLQNESVI